MVCSSPPVYCNPSPCLSTFSCFFMPPPPHPNPAPPLSILHLREFTMEILLRKNKYQWLNKLCYHFDVLLKKVCQRKFNFVGRIKEIGRMHFEAILLQNIFRDKKTININLLQENCCYIC